MSTMYEDVDMENPDGVSGDGSDVCDGLIGVVVNCLSLNIREKASADSNVIAEAKALDELKIDMANSNDDWYAVCTVAGIEGFCMKKFIAVIGKIHHSEPIVVQRIIFSHWFGQ